MMRIFVGLVALMLVWGAAADKPMPPKRLCALELYGGKPWLAEFEVDLGSTAVPIETQVKMQGVVAADGVTRMVIVEVIECAPPGQPFASAAANKLLETSPR